MRASRRLPLEALEPFLLTPPDPPAPVDWAAIFGNEQPLELEVGSGKGLFLFNAAAARPDVNFVGVEIERKYALVAATRMARHGRKNVRLVAADALRFLSGCVATASVAALHVYFPDPWWKRRHRKRRVFTETFVADCVRVLRPGGLFHVATDVEEYFGIIKELLDARPELTPLPPPTPKDAAHDMDYLTNFERRFRKEGKPIYRALYERRP